jgi:hypothetical protein
VSEKINRRSFIKTTALAGAGIAGAWQFADGFALPAASSSVLYGLCSSLTQQWGKQLLAMQITDKQRADDYGGIWCPADKAVHGRVGDAIYPFFYLASQTKDSRYTDAAMLLYRWIERRVSQPDGSWLNEPQKGSWQGTTVFASIAMGETLKHHGAMMDQAFKSELSERLKKAGEYIYKTFNINFGNINYPISASYGLSLLGEVLDEPKFKVKGRELAKQALAFFTLNDHLFKGEGDPYYEASKKGCFSVDLGYNVEESLPALVQYGLLTKDEEVLQAVTRSMQTHMEFMLPDGGWDNSWGTRNYKWTYYGSRTTDGCQPAYALLADRDPRFYRAALLNTQLMQRTTVNGLLQGGPHTTGGALTMLWHKTTGPILSASMNEYQMVEAGNQQVETDPYAMPLTPRIELRNGKELYMNISDHNAVITTEDIGGKLIIKSQSKLVDRDQKDPATGVINCEVNYEFTADKVTIHYKHNGDASVKIIFPLIAKASEKIVTLNNKALSVKREQGGLVRMISSQPLITLPTTNGRVFNFVPGLEAVPFVIEQNEVTIEISVA